ncbi:MULTISPECIES: IclR family transcriptional regulator [unclassified Streptomyces]|uniref:IclR family transcriptional regulator n=1 Tax=unclassified Streptomyces TaxID=2593676 RepID=UPI000DBAB655|nr:MULTISPECIES: IclR family transcriptional regulator [unclassified Streptomyces]MYT75509.1 helix-turn-helix domain-containing protein [Streptomyces sp. SID8367]RAJ86915.1 IclR family transcriptional regulator [Streptomyces sp. PsTaAH-137]
MPTSASPAVGRALDILLHLSGRPGPVRAPALAADLGIPRSSVYHILTVLVDRGFVTYIPEGQLYGLGVSAFEVGSAYLRHEPLERLARPLVRTLARELGQPVHLGVLHGAESVYLLKELPSASHTPEPAPDLVTDVGVRLPAHLTANGRALLAHSSPAQVRALFPTGPLITRTGRGPRTPAELRRGLADERERGWSEEVGLVTEGMRSLAVPAFDHLGQPVAALSTTWRQAAGRHSVEEIAERLRRAAARLTAAMLGHSPA